MKRTVLGRRTLHFILTMLAVLCLCIGMTATVAAENPMEGWNGNTIGTGAVIVIGNKISLESSLIINDGHFVWYEHPYTLVRGNLNDDGSYVEAENGTKLFFVNRNGEVCDPKFDLTDYPYVDGLIVTRRSAYKYGNFNIQVAVHESQEKKDKAAAQVAIDAIAAIGTVENTEECKAKIDAARKAYEALTDAQKQYVTNYNTLTAAENRYRELNPHKVTVVAPENGEVRIYNGSNDTQSEFKEDETVQLNVQPHNNYKLKSLYYIEAGSTEHVDITNFKNSFYTFVMPYKDVTVYAEFTDVVCKVKADDSMTHGSLQFYDEGNKPRDEFKVNERVYIKVVPDDGYAVAGTPVAKYNIYPVPNSDQYYLNMPYSKLPDEIVVSCSFIKLIKEINITVDTPRCGESAPSAAIPQGAEYSIANVGGEYDSLNWLPEGKTTSATYVTGGETYNARIFLEPNTGCRFSDNIIAKVNGTPVSSIDFMDNGQIKLVSEPIKAQHNFDKKVEAKTPTCTKEGNIEYWTCENCRRCFSDNGGNTEVSLEQTVVPASGHNWGTWTVTKEATEDEEGVEERVCLNDASHKDTRAIPKTGHITHKLTKVDGKPASCTKSGQNEYYKCSECSAIFADEAGEVQVSEGSIRIPAKGHKVGDPIKGEETAATCDLVGGYNLTFKCTECKKVVRTERVVIPFAHKWGAWTATSDGVETRTCSSCGEKETRRVSPSGGGADPSQADADSDVDKVVKMITDLPAADQIQLTDEAAVKAAREAYDKLSDEQKKDSKLTAELVKKLTDCEAQIEEAKKSGDAQKAAGEVTTKINALPDDPSKANAQDVADAVAAYKALSDTAKQLVTEGELNKLQAAMDYPASSKKATIKSAKAQKGKKTLVKWKKVSGVTGYQLYYKAKGGKAKKVNITKASTLKKTVKKLKAGKKYSFKVRTYTKVENLSTGKMKNVYGKWSKIKKAKAKK